MSFDIKKIFTNTSNDVLVFQVCEAFVEVVALRNDAESISRSEYAPQVLYSKRLPRVARAKLTKAFAEKVANLAYEAIESPELVDGFDYSRVICTFVQPLSLMAQQTYGLALPSRGKITNSILQEAMTGGELFNNTIDAVPQEYVLYNELVRSVRLNGYEVESPLGLDATDIELTIEQHLLLPDVWSGVGTVLEKVFNRQLEYQHLEKVTTLDSAAFCKKIYTGNALHQLGSAIL